MRNGLIYRLPTWERGTDESESSYWLTPSATDIGARSDESMRKRKAWRNSIGRTTIPPGNLAEQVRYGEPTKNMIPTPTTQDLLNRKSTQQKEGSMHSVTLGDYVRRFPTPSARDPGWKHIEVVDKNGKPPAHPNQRFYDKKTGRVVQKGLTQIAQMYPTPRASDSTGGYVETVRTEDGAYSSERKASGHRFGAKLQDAIRFETKKPTGKLNPTWVEWLMGFPLAWTELNASETPSSRRSQKSLEK